MGKPEHQEEATSGVKKIELYKKVWTKRDKIVMFVGYISLI
jgi:hypothetical protein